MSLTVRCPQCGNYMRYASTDRTLLGKTKQCVYCNRSFKVRDHLAARAPAAPAAEFKPA